MEGNCTGADLLLDRNICATNTSNRSHPVVEGMTYVPQDKHGNAIREGIWNIFINVGPKYSVFAPKAVNEPDWTTSGPIYKKCFRTKSTYFLVK